MAAERHLAFGDVAAAWGMLDELGVMSLIDEAAGPQRAGQRCPRDLPGAGGAQRLVACSKDGVRGLVEDHRGGRFTGSAPPRWTRRFWDAMHAVTLEQLEQASGQIAARVVQVSVEDVSSVALDMTNFATFIATANGKAPIAQRGKAKQKRTTCGWSGWAWW